METVSVTEAKTHLSRLLRRVARGESILIVHRGRPVARIGPAGESTTGAEALDALEREGVLRRASLPPDADVLRGPRPEMPAGRSLLAALLEEREESR